MTVGFGTDTLAGRILAGAQAHAGVRAVFDAPQGRLETTVGALVADAEKVAGALQHAGVGPGDVVAVQLGSNRDGFVAQVAVALSGAVLLPIVQIYGPRELSYILQQSGAVAFVAADRFRGRDHLATLDRTTMPASSRTLVIAGERIPDGALSLTDLCGAGARPFTLPDRAPDDRAMLMYTSGTTADPKGVQHSHRTLLAEVDSPTLKSGDSGVRQLALFPSGHVAGLLGMCRIMVHGVPTVVQEVWDAATAAALVDEYALTYAVGAPVQLAGLLDQQASGAASLATITEVMTGGASVPHALIERADTAGIMAYRCYGSSEHPTISSGTVADDLWRRAHTDGRVLHGSEVRIVDELGADVEPGEPGEIASRGGELFVGYTDARLDRDAFLPGGWFRTGDIGVLDGDGYLTVTDRKKDIIIRGGENISAKEVEDVLSGHPAVAEVAVVGMPDPLMGERVAAFVVPMPQRGLDLDEAREHFATAGLARQKTPERLEIVTELPRTPAGKIQKFALRDRLR